MVFDEFKKKFIEWIIENIEPVQDNGFSVCPYAKQARLANKIQFLDASSLSYNVCLEFDASNYEVGIAWLGNNIVNVDPLIKKLSKNNQDLFYFLSTTESGYFVKNFSNCIFIQKKEDILTKRKILLYTNYYNNWPKEYFDKIVG